MDINENITKFFYRLEEEVRDLEYGTLSINVFLKDGVPDMNSINIVRQKRKRFPRPNDTKEVNNK